MWPAKSFEGFENILLASSPSESQSTLVREGGSSSQPDPGTEGEEQGEEQERTPPSPRPQILVSRIGGWGLGGAHGDPQEHFPAHFRSPRKEDGCHLREMEMT